MAQYEMTSWHKLTDTAVTHANLYHCSHSLGLNPLNAELNPIWHLLALLGAHHFLHVSTIRVKALHIYIYIYGAPIVNVSRSHTTTHYSR